DRGAGFPVDLGASWIHGIEGSAVWDLARTLSVPTIEFTVGSFQAGGRPLANFDDAGDLMDAAATDQWVADVAAADLALQRLVTGAPHGETYLAATERVLSAMPLDEERIENVREFFRHRVEEQCGAWIGDLDAHGLDEDIIDGDEVIFARGYDELSRTIADGLDVRLNEIVRAISWTAHGVIVQTDASTFEAAHAIVTVPLGVLKAGAIAFEPPLPDSVTAPIERLGMGVFNKIFLQFPQPFWDDGLYAIRQLGTPGEHWHSWYDVSAVSGTPMLLTFAAGPWGREVQEWDDTVVVTDVVETLRGMFGESVPDPVAHWITRWGQDPFSVGSYSYVAAGASHHDHDAIAEPVGGVLHLAGEATWGSEPATVEGAFRSGHRAAGRILGREVDLAAFFASL
ncbi:MAG TPA: NAD(P)/FAD-dependent oxidoreductase, partial [Humibacter sp.]|nr:NAD(P)/FAD-dependent oxidoreductase [Humibacter sp.]